MARQLTLLLKSISTLKKKKKQYRTACNVYPGLVKSFLRPSWPYFGGRSFFRCLSIHSSTSWNLRTDPRGTPKENMKAVRRKYCKIYQKNSPQSPKITSKRSKRKHQTRRGSRGIYLSSGLRQIIIDTKCSLQDGYLCVHWLAPKYILLLLSYLLSENSDDGNSDHCAGAVVTKTHWDTLRNCSIGSFTRSRNRLFLYYFYWRSFVTVSGPSVSIN